MQGAEEDDEDDVDDDDTDNDQEIVDTRISN